MRDTRPKRDNHPVKESWRSRQERLAKEEFKQKADEYMYGKRRPVNIFVPLNSLVG